MKVCCTCKLKKEVSDFYKSKASSSGLDSRCILCTKEYKTKNRELINNRQRYRYSKNKDQLNLARKLKYAKDKDEISKKRRLSDKTKANEASRKYRAANKDKVKAWKSAYVKKKWREDRNFRIQNNLRVRLHAFLKRSGIVKKQRFIDFLGCSFENFTKYLESQFQPGMTWGNRKDWHIDHIIPLSSAKTEDEIYKLNHYTNLQPLWAEDNLKKSDKII